MEETDSNTIVMVDFNYPVSSMDISYEQKVNRDRGIKGNIRLDGLDSFVQNIPSKCSRIYILLKDTWNFFKYAPYVGTQTSLKKFKKIEIISSNFSDHSGMKLEINYKKKTGKNHSYVETTACYWTNIGPMKNSKEHFLEYLKINENKNMTYQIYEI